MDSRIHRTLPLVVFGASLALASCALELEIDEQHDEIVGGQNTEISLVPWQVSLQAGNGSHFCGGSIVAPTWIITASHCVEAIPPAQIVAGSTLLSQPGAGQVRRVVRSIVYPGYTDPTVGKDIALLELQSPLELNGTTVRAIRPVKLADAQSGVDAPGVLATISGWGTLTEGGNIPDTLQSVQVPIVSLQDASADYAGTGVPLPLTSDQLPAGVRGIGGKDSCQGDSGGPLVVRNRAGTDYQLAGVVSWGIGCAQADFPGLYARVSAFTSWIDGYVGGPPVAVAGEDSGAGAGEIVQLDASGSYDLGFGDIVSYSWRQVGGQSTVTLENSGASVASFAAPAAADGLEFELTVTDDTGTSSTDRLTVTVQAPSIPDPIDNPDNSDNPGNPDIPGDPSQPSPYLVGGCSTSSGNAGGLMSVLALLALCVTRRRTAR